MSKSYFSHLSIGDLIYHFILLKCVFALYLPYLVHDPGIKYA